MTLTPSTRWFASFALAPLVWVFFVFPLPQVAGGAMLSDSWPDPTRVLGVTMLLYLVSSVLLLPWAIAGAAVLRLTIGRGWSRSRWAAPGFVALFPMGFACASAFVVFAVGSTADMRNPPESSAWSVLLALPWIGGMLAVRFHIEAAKTLAIAAAFALWIGWRRHE